MNEEIEEIKTYMKANKITYKKLTEMTGLGISTIKDTFRGETSPNLTTLTKIKSALGFDRKHSFEDVENKLTLELGKLGIATEELDKLSDEQIQLLVNMAKQFLNK